MTGSENTNLLSTPSHSSAISTYRNGPNLPLWQALNTSYTLLWWELGSDRSTLSAMASTPRAEYGTGTTDGITGGVPSDSDVSATPYFMDNQIGWDLALRTINAKVLEDYNSSRAPPSRACGFCTKDRKRRHVPCSVLQATR